MNTTHVAYELRQQAAVTLRRGRYWTNKKIRFLKRHYPFQSLMTSGFILLFITLIITPRGGKILPVDPHMVHAYSLLSKTPTGKQLIKRVKKSTAGSYIYLSLGSTEKDRLFDYYGNSVRGVTRATFEYCNRMLVPKSVTVITNSDLIGLAPRDIIRSIAFELENVDYSFRKPQFDFPEDSPRAAYTQQLVLAELDL